MSAFLSDIKRKLETEFDVFGAKTVRALVAEIDSLTAQRDGYQATVVRQQEQLAAKDEALRLAREALERVKPQVKGALVIQDVERAIASIAKATR